ncbi:ABC transporter substrate-binding protein [Vulcanimicrobium alpinum]|uniref:ABC transporter substrate-binding protein n=1 Tax=Vulcanimicrobium alpinum TaxID=3016050 RepID=A0AAN2CB43_UNVUL|nr:peptide ABC transporter substrate-binding protein [Vulcanimicrobium alpinum]BDE07826.1 ABC transporter substrate-binding protein [Vulcanimicrobium alpinum]
MIHLALVRRRRLARVRWCDLARAACAAALLAGCAQQPAAQTARPAGTHPWTIPGKLRIGIAGTLNTLDPILSTQQIEAFAQTFVLDPLIATDPAGRDVPVLAAEVPTLENGGISRDGLTITYHLRHGVKWHDGAPFTSRDVAFTVAAIMNPNTNVATRHGYDRIARVETPDAYTVVFRLKAPFAPAVHTFFAHSDAPYMIMPAHLLAKYHDLNRVPFNESPVGTGPFKIERWVRGDRIEYVRNPGYFLGKPRLQSIELRFVPDENTLVNQLRAHEIDWFAQATPRVYPQLKTIDGVDVRLVPFNGNDAIIINLSRLPLDDVRVRRAIGLAIDKGQLVRDATFGTTVAATEDLPPLLWAFDPRAGTSRRDLPRARALLDAAGWHAGVDGIRARNGKRLELGVAYRSDSATDRQRSVLIASMLREAGIEIALKGYTTALLYGAPGNGILADGKYDLGLQTWYAGSDPDDSTQLLCSELAPHGYNWSRYCSPEMDAAQKIALTNYDRPTRKRAYATIESLLARDAPFIYLWWPRQIEAVSTDLKNFRPNGIVESWNAWQFEI